MVKKRILLMGSITILATILLFMIPATALAYTWTAPYPKWYQTTVYYDHTALPFDWRTQVTLAAYTWNDTPANFNVYYGTSTNIWSQYNYGPISRCGVTDIYGTGTPPDQIVRCVSVFNTYYTFNIGSDTDVRTVALHEFGHWLALDDNPWAWWWETEKRSCVMYGEYLGVKTTLQQDDIDGIVAIYGY